MLKQCLKFVTLQLPDFCNDLTFNLYTASLTLFLHSDPLLVASDFFYFYCTREGRRYRRALSEAHKHSEKVSV